MEAHLLVDGLSGQADASGKRSKRTRAVDWFPNYTGPQEYHTVNSITHPVDIIHTSLVALTSLFFFVFGLSTSIRFIHSFVGRLVLRNNPPLSVCRVVDFTHSCRRAD